MLSLSVKYNSIGGKVCTECNVCCVGFVCDVQYQSPEDNCNLFFCAGMCKMLSRASVS